MIKSPCGARAVRQRAGAALCGHGPAGCVRGSPCRRGASDALEVLARARCSNGRRGGFRALTWGARRGGWRRSGVKSSRAIGAAGAARGPVIGYFPLLSKSAGELVVGENDRHLDFRVAILLRTGRGGAGGS